MSDLPRDTVIVTGFGSYENCEVNASWKVAEELLNLKIEEELGIKLITRKMEVSYKSVAENIPKLWEKHEPILVVHMGVNSDAGDLQIETCAYKSGYTMKDNDGNTPPIEHCSQDSCEKIEAMLDLEKVAEEVNQTEYGVPASTSCEAGRYLCEFIYYKSLCINKTRTVFIHVPVTNEEDYPTVHDLAEGVKKIICCIINQIKSQNNPICMESCIRV